MFNYFELTIALFMSALATFILTFFVKEFAVRFKFIDVHDYRKIHITPTPRLGGLAIYFGFLIALLYLEPHAKHLPAIIIGSGIIVLTGALDDRYCISAGIKVSGQTAGAAVVVFSGLVIKRDSVRCFG